MGMRSRRLLSFVTFGDVLLGVLMYRHFEVGVWQFFMVQADGTYSRN